MKENFMRCVEPLLKNKEVGQSWIISEGIIFTDVVAGNHKLDEISLDKREEMRKYVERMCDEYN